MIGGGREKKQKNHKNLNIKLVFLNQEKKLFKKLIKTGLCWKAKNYTTNLDIHTVTSSFGGQNWPCCTEENRDNDKQHRDY